MKMKLLIIIPVFCVLANAQRPSFASSGPIGRPSLGSRFKDVVPSSSTTVGFENRVGENGSTQKIPVDARGDSELVDTLSSWKKENQPFWLLNADHIERQRNTTRPPTTNTQNIQFPNRNQIESTSETVVVVQDDAQGYVVDYKRQPGGVLPQGALDNQRGTSNQNNRVTQGSTNFNNGQSTQDNNRLTNGSGSSSSFNNGQSTQSNNRLTSGSGSSSNFNNGQSTQGNNRLTTSGSGSLSNFNNGQSTQGNNRLTTSGSGSSSNFNNGQSTQGNNRLTGGSGSSSNFNNGQSTQGNNRPTTSFNNGQGSEGFNNFNNGQGSQNTRLPSGSGSLDDFTDSIASNFNNGPRGTRRQQNNQRNRGSGSNNDWLSDFGSNNNRRTNVFDEDSQPSRRPQTGTRGQQDRPRFNSW